MKNPSQHGEHEVPQPVKSGFWRKLGGGALSIAIIIHVTLAIGGGIWIAQRIFAPENEDVDFASGSRTPGGGEQHAQSQVDQKMRAQISPDVKRVVIENMVSNVSILDPGEKFGEMAALTQLTNGSLSSGPGGPGSGDRSGKDKWGGPSMVPGDASGPLFPTIPEMGKRCSKQDRLARIKETGGTAACEDAVVKGLRWLKANQNPDGSWGAANKPAMTGLALLAYFGHCETPSTLSEEFGESCMKGVVYLIDLGMKNNGILTPNIKVNSAPYEHAIATYAMGEAATFCRELKIELPNLVEVTGKAGQFIIDNQHKNGGWSYGYATDQGHTDSSVVGWQLQALKACSHAHIPYQGLNSAVDKGLRYLSTLQNESGAFGYNSPGGRTSLTGVGVLCFQMWDKGKSSEVRKGVKFIKDNFKLDWNTADSDLYSHYYASQAMMQAGSSHWKSYNERFRDQLLNNQNPDGSWKAPAFTGHGLSPGNDVYRNTLCILMLEVYYRFLNTSGGGRNERPDF